MHEQIDSGFNSVLFVFEQVQSLASEVQQNEPGVHEIILSQ